MKKEWFADWFDSPYYHLLYKNRDEQEAHNSIDHFVQALGLPHSARLLDLACGKGRHARYLAEKGFDVIGLDISASSITYARQFEHAQLAFYQHDMRQPYRVNYFDAILNFFTSFGYFETDKEHQKTLVNVAKGLKTGGQFLLDYFNSQWVRDHIVRKEEKHVDNITFHLKKSIKGAFIYKSVEFETGGRVFHFQERVRLFTLEDLTQMLQCAGLRVRQIYGNYQLESYNLHQSKRLIILAEK